MSTIKQNKIIFDYILDRQTLQIREAFRILEFDSKTSFADRIIIIVDWHLFNNDR